MHQLWHLLCQGWLILGVPHSTFGALLRLFWFGCWSLVVLLVPVGVWDLFPSLKRLAHDWQGIKQGWPVRSVLPA